MPRGASPQREREFDGLRERFQQEGRYPGREEEVAARIVNKQRAATGETRAQHDAARHGQDPDRDLPLPGYQHLTATEVISRCRGLSPSDRRRVARYEAAHRNRLTILRRLAVPLPAP